MKSLFCILFLFCTIANAQFVEQSIEIQVNTYTAGQQRGSVAASDINGNYVVVWTSLDQDPNPYLFSDNYGVYAQRFNAMGEPIGSEFRVNNTTDVEQSSPSIAMDTAGNFVIVWQNRISGVNGFDIYARQYSKTGNAISDEFIVNSTLAGNQVNPDVAIDYKGNFVVCWADNSNTGLTARKFLSTGGAAGNEFFVNEILSTYNCLSPEIAMDSTGAFVIAWNYYTSSNYALGGVHARRYDKTTNPLGSEFKVQTTGHSYQYGTSIDMDNNGNFIIGWSAFTNSTDKDESFIRRYDASGTPLGNQYIINTTKNLYQGVPQLKINDNGTFLAVWESSTARLFGQRFDASGNFVGVEFAIGTSFVQNSNYYPYVAGDKNGNYMVTFTNFNGNDGNGNGIFVKQYGTNSIPLITPANFQLLESATIGNSIGTVVATDADISQLLTFEITSGNNSNTFSIDPISGVLQLEALLDYETENSYLLEIKVSDNGSPKKYSKVTIVITIEDVNEYFPVFSPSTISIISDGQAGNVIQKIAATDADIDQVMTYSIISGNTNNNFLLDPVTGDLKILNQLPVGTSYNLVLEASDNGTPSKTATLIVDVSISNPTNFIDKSESAVLLFPNPASDKLYIESPSDLEVKLINNIGEQLFDRKLHKDNEPINLIGISPGAYQLVITDSKNNKTIRKLIIE